MSHVTTLPVAPRQVTYDFLQLKDWYDHVAMTALTLPGVVMTDIDEANNRLTFGVTELRHEAAVRSLLATNAVPQSVVHFEQWDPVVPQNSLQNYHRPLVGGAMHRTPEVHRQRNHQGDSRRRALMARRPASGGFGPDCR